MSFILCNGLLCALLAVGIASLGSQASIQPDAQYEWLEPPQDLRALQWSIDQTERTISHLSALTQTSHVVEKIEAILKDSYTRPVHSFSGGKVFRVRYTDKNIAGVLEATQRTENGSIEYWKPVVDLDALGRAENLTYQTGGGNFMGSASPDGTRYILNLFELSGTVLREVDVATGQIVSDGFNLGHGVHFFTWLDADRLLISQTFTPGSPVTGASYPASWQIWERGTPLSKAKTVLEISDPTSLGAFAWPLGGYGSGYGLLAELLSGTSGFRFHIHAPDGTIKKVNGLPENLVSRLEMMESTNQHLILMTTRQEPLKGRIVPAGTLFAYDFSSCKSQDESKISIIWTPGPDDFTPHAIYLGLRASASRVHLTTTSHGVERRLVFEYLHGAWQIVHEIEAVSPGTLVLLEAGDKASDDFIIVETGLIQAPLVTLRGSDEEAIPLFEHAEYFDPNNFVIESSTAETLDGTMINYLLVSPTSFDHLNSTAGRRPVLLHAYASFGIALELSYFDAHLVPWLESGGSIAYAFPRGGGERGNLWHDAARGAQLKQNTWDDLKAVAEALIDGFTSPSNLGFWGHSAGGLAAGVMYTQYPDLFGAVVADSPVLDALRFIQMSPQGIAWIDEYGDPRILEDAEVIRKWSPFHNIHAGADYPPLLTTVANSDLNTGTGHPRKMVARAQDTGSEAYLYVVDNGGHNPVNARINPKLAAHRMAFLMHYLMDGRRGLASSS